MLVFRAAAAQRARERAITHCSLRTHMKHRDASCCQRNVYDILISLNRAFVFELWIEYDSMPRLQSLCEGLPYFGIFDKQDRCQVKPQRRSLTWKLLIGRLKVQATDPRSELSPEWVDWEQVFQLFRTSLACLLSPSSVLFCSRSGGVVEMLRKSSSPLIRFFGTAVACRSELCVMSTS